MKNERFVAGRIRVLSVAFAALHVAGCEESVLLPPGDVISLMRLLVS
jgi:hypothetical protein